MGAGAKIIESLREAVAGKFSSVTIDGVTWRPDGGWQPIETAPKDGTDIIVYRPSDRPNEYIPDVGVDYFSKRLGDVWAKSNESKQPTHWMPLPHPPRSP